MTLIAAELIGRTLAHYRITAAIGAGGMGEVFRATDTKLEREVALKVLPAAVAADPERLGRFQREARAVAALNHPHIVTLYSVEEAEGIHFLTMELVDGQSLERMIAPGGMEVAQIAEIAMALGDALAAAHERNIVHRDLKPANVMVSSEGRVKVLDFGLAKDVSQPNVSDATRTSADQTQAGMVMGTPAYMSPEQIAGRPLDHRTDIFSLGVMLHEMATGKKPFAGGSTAELLSAILRDSPVEVTELRPELPADLARIIRRCMEKDPRHRVQTARDVANEFRDMARHGSGRGAVVPGSARPGSGSSPGASSGAAVRASSGARPGGSEGKSGAVRTSDAFWVAVLPFKYSGTNADLTALAEGLTEEIVTGMARFPYLKVVARSSTMQYANQDSGTQSGTVEAVGKALGARYVIEGNLRLAGTKLRVAVQLVDTDSGAHLWAETYERGFSPEAVFEIQDELVPRIVSTIADAHGILPHTLGEAVRAKRVEELTPYEAVLRGFNYAERVSPEEHLAARTALERAVEEAPNYAYAWAMLAMVWGDEYALGFNPQPDPLGRTLKAARKAVELDPTNHRSFQALAVAQFHLKDFQKCRAAAERAIALNPMDGCTIAHVGGLLAYSGDWEHGCALVERALGLNPNHPGWFWFALFFNAYRKGEYREALKYAINVNMPGFNGTHAAFAMVYGQLGEVEAAGKALEELLAQIPNYGAIAREVWSARTTPEMAEHVLDGLRKAGLEIPEEASAEEAGAKADASSGASAKASSGATVKASSGASAVGSGAVRADGSGAVRTSEGFWVAVLPFKTTSAELSDLADGLSEGTVAGLSRFSYMRVIARGSTARYANEATDLRTVGRELGARYVMEGNLRKAGAKMRLAVQLVDATTGAHLWAQTYEREYSADAIFDLQDDLVPRIVSSVADQYGALPRCMADVLRSKNEEELTAHEAVLRAFGYFEQIAPEEHLVVRRILERAVEKSPNQADCWAMLSTMYRGEFAQGFNQRPDPLGRSLEAAQKAVELAPASHLGHFALASTMFFQKDLVGFRVEGERALALNPMDGSSMAYIGLLIAGTGDWERGCALVGKAKEMNPNYPGWYDLVYSARAYSEGDYEKALEFVTKANLARYYMAAALKAAMLGQMGDRAGAGKAVEGLRAMRPEFAEQARAEFGKWWGPELVEKCVEGLRKAGMEVG
jgi:TolB-like protein